MRNYKNEGDVKDEVKKLLNITPLCWWFMPSANGYGRSGIPDFIGSVRGRLFAVETKFGRGVLTAHQTRELAMLDMNNNECWVVNEKNIQEWKAEFVCWSNNALNT
jgi:hypothetical protein